MGEHKHIRREPIKQSLPFVVPKGDRIKAGCIQSTAHAAVKDVHLLSAYRVTCSTHVALASLVTLNPDLNRNPGLSTSRRDVHPRLLEVVQCFASARPFPVHLQLLFEVVVRRNPMIAADESLDAVPELRVKLGSEERIDALLSQLESCRVHSIVELGPRRLHLE